MNLIECVPNISEGRQREFLDGLAAELRALDGVALLDYSGDFSHHRSVYTLAGAGTDLHHAVIAIAARAIAAIDLHHHRGGHPRIGALDVVPFIPLGATPMAECVALARTVGHDLAARFALPVYLYEQASARPGRTRLEHLRRGQFEGLAAKMTDPGWAPDFGPQTPHPTAGATAVGARRALIAYNVNLASDRLDVARRIARAIRESNGGFACVKAMGVMLHERGVAQVSMNLTDYERTPIQVVFDRVVEEAARDGVAVLESELIGLIPAAALSATTPGHLRLAAFSDSQILETQLRRHGFDV